MNESEKKNTPSGIYIKFGHQQWWAPVASLHLSITADGRWNKNKITSNSKIFFFNDHAILFTSQEGHLEFVLYLANISHDVNSRRNDGASFVYYAAKNGHSYFDWSYRQSKDYKEFSKVFSQLWMAIKILLNISIYRKFRYNK